MILRYFYIDQYNEVAKNLDINLGGKYRFHYLPANNELKIIKNEEYVNNLYEEYDVISDVSAILGKNSAGKTTVLRMINSLFNGLNIYNKEQYIIVFEKKDDYSLYTNYMQIKYDEEILDKRVQCEENKYFNAIDILKDVGLIYFSNIFDKATPFQGNANLIDISTNYLFERFYKDNIRGKIRKDNEKVNVMDEYKSDNILDEIDFLIDIKPEISNENESLLFDVPTQIELGFSQVLPDFGNTTFCYNEEYNHYLMEINKSLRYYLCEDQEFEGAVISLFKREMIFYFLFDELCSFCKADRYNVSDALMCWMNKIENQNWEISDYYQEILEELRKDNSIADESNIASEEDFETEEEVFMESTYNDIWDDFEILYNQLSATESIDFHMVMNKMTEIRDFLEREQWKNYHAINFYLKKAEYLLQEAHDDLIHHDYDLYNITCIYEAYDFVEKAYNIYNGEKFAYFFQEDMLNNESIEPLDNDERATVKMYFDTDTENHLSLLQKVIETLMDFTEKYNYDADANMLKVELECDDIQGFIHDFRELECKTVVLDTKRNDISSGHSAYLDMCSRINSAKKSGEIHRKENVILLIDEGDIYLHPEKQLAYMNNLLKLLQILYKKKKVQLIITSNSPFIISDIQSSNILYLEKQNGIIKVSKSAITNTFASNVNVLLLDSFFVENGLIGEYARKKIDSILQDLLNGELSEEKYLHIENIIKIIGEPVIRRKLETMLFHNTPNVQRERQYYENRLRQMENRAND